MPIYSNTNLANDADDLVFNYYIDKGIEPKNTSEDERVRIIRELFIKPEPKFEYQSLKEYLGNSFSAYCGYLEDFEEYNNYYDESPYDYPIQECSPVDVMNKLWYIYGREIDYDDLQERIDFQKPAEEEEDEEDEEEQEEEIVLLPTQQ